MFILPLRCLFNERNGCASYPILSIYNDQGWLLEHSDQIFWPADSWQLYKIFLTLPKYLNIQYLYLRQFYRIRAQVGLSFAKIDTSISFMTMNTGMSNFISQVDKQEIAK